MPQAKPSCSLSPDKADQPEKSLLSPIGLRAGFMEGEHEGKREGLRALRDMVCAVPGELLWFSAYVYACILSNKLGVE